MRQYGRGKVLALYADYDTCRIMPNGQTARNLAQKNHPIGIKNVFSLLNWRSLLRNCPRSISNTVGL